MYAIYPKKEIIINIRGALRKDLPKVLYISAGSFEFPWLDNDFMNCLQQRNCISVVAEIKDAKKYSVMVGFMIYEFNKFGIHVLSFAVHPDWRRQGIGTQMINKLIAKLSPQKFKRIILKVAETNLPAQLFLRKCGFRAINVLHKYYYYTSEDAYIMQYRHKAPPSKIKKPENSNFLLRVTSFLRNPKNNP